MTQNRLKNAFRWPKKFDDQIDQISYLLQKSGNLWPKEGKLL